MQVYKQANSDSMTYLQAFQKVLAEDGVAGLLFRGLSTKIVANGMSGMLFSVFWKLIDEKFRKLFP